VFAREGKRNALWRWKRFGAKRGFGRRDLDSDLTYLKKRPRDSVRKKERGERRGGGGKGGGEGKEKTKSRIKPFCAGVENYLRERQTKDFHPRTMALAIKRGGEKDGTEGANQDGGYNQKIKHACGCGGWTKKRSSFSGETGRGVYQ